MSGPFDSRTASAGACAPLNHVAISQPLALGDLVATLPMAGAIKQAWPGCRITMLTRPQTRVLANTSHFVDGWLDSELASANPALLAALKPDAFIDPFCWPAPLRAARRAGVPLRVGNWRRPATLGSCNRFVSVSRSHADVHTVRINLAYLRALGIAPPRELNGLFGLTRLAPLRPEFAGLLDPQRFNLVLHPKSGGDGREWPARHYLRLADLLPLRVRLLLTGIPAEREVLARECPALLAHSRIHDLMGRLELEQMIALLAAADGIVASGTGPLHIAAALGRHALGIFPPRRNIDVERWAPIGLRAQHLGLPGRCAPGPGTCPEKAFGPPCACTAAITPEAVAARVSGLIKPPLRSPAV